MITTLLVIFSVITLITTIVLFRLLLITQNKIDIYEKWIIEFRNDLTDVYDDIKRIDDKNLFERDDEVGVIFSEIFKLITKLNIRIQDDVNIEKEK